jgi:hypothetical protein
MSSEGLVTSRRPLPVISNTPISSVGPKRFLTRAGCGSECAAFAFERQHGIDHVLDDAGPAIWPSLVTWPTKRIVAPSSWRKRISA